MIEPVAVVGVLAVGAIGVWIARSTHQARAQTWLRAARECGLVDLNPPEIVGMPRHVSGRKDGLDVRIGSYQHGKSSSGTCIVVGKLGGVAALAIRAESIGTAILKSLGTPEVEVGDAAFDGRFLIEGPAPVALAVLDVATRKKVWSALGGQTAVHGTSGDVSITAEATLSQGQLTFKIPQYWGIQLGARLPGLLRTILDVAAALAAPRDVPRALAENALRDPLWSVRLTNLNTLAREFKGHAETVRALRAACEDPSEDVRLSAASTLGPEGDATLLKLAFEQAPDAIAARAVLALGQRLPIDRAVQHVGDAITSARVETAWACLEALSRHAPEADLATAEPPLLRALEHEEERLRVAAARALGRVGTVAAVLPLQEAAQRFGGELRSASRQAIATIQSRTAGATPGQLSVVEGEAGHLTLARQTGGEVSPAQD
jgi:hypothetical protein